MEEKRNDRPKKTELYMKNMPLRNRGGIQQRPDTWPYHAKINGIINAEKLHLHMLQ